MKLSRKKKVKLFERISLAANQFPLRNLTGSFSKMTRSALKEANTLVIEKIQIYLKRLPKKLDGFRLVHLSDMHHSPFTNLEHIENAVDAANRLKPNMFVLTGDYVSHENKYIEPVAKALGRLESEFGTYACLGNHDHWTDAESVTREMKKRKINVLINEGFRFTANGVSFWLCGVDDHMAGKTDLNAALRGSFADEMKMLLAHNPVVVIRAARLDIDLMFSGHTHGGQVRIIDKEKKLLPHRRLSNGLYRRKNTQIYITRGIGTVVLPVRYQCPPEISLIELRSNQI